MRQLFAGDLSFGRYRGALASRYTYPEFTDQMRNITAILADTGNPVISSGRNRNVLVRLVCRTEPIQAVVKCFAAQTYLKDRSDAIRGSKARRTWLAATALRQKGIGTPPPIGFLECWRAGRLVESYFLSVYQPDLTSLKDEWIRLLGEEPECERFMALMQVVADAVRAMHDAGFQHNDLGNQNILLPRAGARRANDVQFIDLNRGRMRTPMTLRHRARDLSRIHLPSDLFRVFLEMYWGRRAPPPPELRRAEAWHRRLYAVHSGTRKWRHPLRYRNAEPPGGRPDYPNEKDVWIWDERSGQPISALLAKDRRRLHAWSRHGRILASAIAGLGPVWREYKLLRSACYTRPVCLQGRIGVAIHPKPGTVDAELSLLDGLGRLPAIVRFYCHQPERQWVFAADVVNRLLSAGHEVSVALVQDRVAAVNSEWWKSFLDRVLRLLPAGVRRVEVGHAINRVKWGIWDFSEYRNMMEAVADAAREFPNVRLMGPAVIDFEYPFAMAALDTVPRTVRFDALSLHLYVDRRGAPENRQGRFSGLDKFVLARAIARWSPVCEDRFVVTEVNWPLKGTGVYSPVGSPYESPGPRMRDPSVSEDEYADYMLRYLLIALCSGMVDQVFWWRLVARGFGLVDDSDPDAWRPRAAYRALAFFVASLGDAAFYRKETTADGVEWFCFDRPDGRMVCMVYAPEGPVTFRVPNEFEWAADSTGTRLGPNRVLQLGGRPVYLFGPEPGHGGDEASSR